MTTFTATTRTARTGRWHRLSDVAERLLWHRQDQALTSSGWQVTRHGRWHREYRHPAHLAAAIAATQNRTANHGSNCPQ